MAKKELPAIGEPFIVARDLSLKMPMRSAYVDVNLDIPRGSFCSIVAQHGEGKTELLLTLAGRMKQTSGKLVVGGYSLPLRRSKVRAMSGLGFFELVNEVQPVLTVQRVAAAELNLCSKRSGRRSVRSFLAEWGFEDVAKRKIETLDRMTYVRFGIALGLVGDPALLVVDNIESDLTRYQSRKIMEELAGISHERGVTVVVACTDYELAAYADLAIPISDAARRQRDAIREHDRKVANQATEQLVALPAQGEARLQSLPQVEVEAPASSAPAVVSTLPEPQVEVKSSVQSVQPANNQPASDKEGVTVNA